MTKHTKDVMGNDVYYRGTSRTGQITHSHIATTTWAETVLVHNEHGECLGGCGVPLNGEKTIHYNDLQLYDIGDAKTRYEFMQATKNMHLRTELILAVKRFEFAKADSIACTFASSMLPLFECIREIDILPRFKRRAQDLMEKNHEETPA